jgi:hypothetical protein
MKFENANTYNWENAFRGLRHPYESYAKSDTGWYEDTTENEYKCFNQALDIDSRTGKFLGIGPNDMDLAQRMIAAGTPNDKFLRQIFVSMDITAPLYWWKEMDTYKVGTTANSTSTMHKLATTPITLDYFEIDDYESEIFVNKIDQSGLDERAKKEGYIDHWHISDFVEDILIEKLEDLRIMYNQTKDIRYWKELIRWLPESWLQTRTWTANYAVLRQIYHWRKNHKLTEWHQFCDFVLTLPYANELIAYNN